jgi:hypothetical protein
MLMVEVGQAIARFARVAAIERDELLGREISVPAERFEDAEDVVIGDGVALSRSAGVCRGVPRTLCRFYGANPNRYRGRLPARSETKL